MPDDTLSTPEEEPINVPFSLKLRASEDRAIRFLSNLEDRPLSEIIRQYVDFDGLIRAADVKRAAAAAVEV